MVTKFVGFATANIFVALALAAHIFPSHADTPAKLTEENVGGFVRELSAVSNGQRRDLDQYAIADYLMQHIAEQGEFKTTIRYDIEDIADNSRDLKLNKNNYISDLLQGLKHNGPQEAKPVIEYVKVDAGGQSAIVMVDMPERGILPVTDASGAKNMMLVSGTSYCEQHIILNSVHVMQVIGTSCTTDMALAGGS